MIMVLRKCALPLVLCMTGWLACGPGAEENDTEVNVDDKITNADLIRNPVSATGHSDTSKIAVIRFEETSFDFGAVKEGIEVVHEFAFSNTGKEVLLIRDARSSCGCTVPEWPDEPIPPGGTGKIKVRFDSSNRKGKVDKEVNIIANTNPFMTHLYITGKVE